VLRIETNPTVLLNLVHWRLSASNNAVRLKALFDWPQAVPADSPVERKLDLQDITDIFCISVQAVILEPFSVETKTATKDHGPKAPLSWAAACVEATFFSSRFFFQSFRKA
jgi:hypothetical protein